MTTALEFTATFADQASGPAEGLKRTMRGLGGQVAPIDASVEMAARGIEATEGDVDSALDRIVRDSDRAGGQAGDEFVDGWGDKVKRIPDESADVGKRSGSGFGSAFKGALAAVGSLIAFDVVKDQLLSTIGAASDLSETVNKSSVIFGANMGAVEAWASGSARSVGLSRAAALDAAAGYGNMLSQLGYTGEAAAETSMATVQLAADLGSFNNLDTADVNDRISAALRGEYDSLQALIPNINAARVEQEALGMTGKSSASDLTAAEKAAATLAIVQRDGAAAANDFAETSDGVANSQKIAAAQAEDLRAKLGAGLQPIVQSLFGWLNSTAIPALSGFVDGMQNGTGAGGRLMDVLRGIGDAFATTVQWVREHSQLMSFLGTVLGTVVAVIGTVVAAMRIWAGVQALLNVVMSANPIGIIIVAVAALVAAIVWIATQTTWFQDIWATVWGAIQSAAGAVMDWLRGALDWIVSTWSSVWGTVSAVASTVWAMIVAVVSGYIEAVRAVIVGVITTIASTWSNIWNSIQAVVGAVVGGIRGVIDQAMNSIRSIISGVMNIVKGIFSGNWEQIKEGVSQVLGGVIGLVAGIPARIIGALGNVGRTLYDSGRSIIQGLIDGISNMVGKVKDAVSGVLSKARDLLPFSPAKEGPFSGKGWTLYSGMSIPAALAEGIARNAGMVQDEVEAMMSAASVAASPTIGASVAGSTAGRSSTMGPSVVTIRHQVDLAGDVPAGLTAQELARILAGDQEARATLEQIVRETTRARSVRTVVAN